MTKKKLKMMGTKEDKDQEKESRPSSTTETEAPVDPEMPPLEDTDEPMKPKQFKFKKPTPTKKHYKKK